MGEEHFGLLSPSAGLGGLLGSGQPAGYVPCRLEDMPGDRPRRQARAALVLQRAGGTVRPAGAVAPEPVAGDPGSRHRHVAPVPLQQVACRSGVLVCLRVESELRCRTGPIAAQGPVDDGNVWLHSGPVDQQAQYLAGAVGGVGCQTFGRDRIAPSYAPSWCGSIRPRPGGSPGSPHIHDHGMIRIDQGVVGVGEMRWSLLGAGPLCGRIGIGHELGLRVDGRAKGGVVKDLQILPHRARCGGGLDPGLLPERLRRRILSVCIARIRLASAAKVSPPTRPSEMHRATTASKSCRNRSLSRNRPCWFFAKVE